MKKAYYIVLSLIIALSLAGCGNSDADRNDNTKDGVIGDGLGEDMKDLGDDIRDAGDDILGGGNVGSGTQNGSTDGNRSSTGTNGNGGTGANGSTSSRPYGTGTNVNSAPANDLIR